MECTAGVSGCIRIRDDKELAQRLMDHIMYRLSGRYIREERRRGYRDIFFSASMYPCFINYPREDYIELYRMAGRDCIGGNIILSDGYEHRCHRYNAETSQWTELKGPGSADSRNEVLVDLTKEAD